MSTAIATLPVEHNYRRMNLERNPVLQMIQKADAQYGPNWVMIQKELVVKLLVLTISNYADRRLSIVWVNTYKTILAAHNAGMSLQALLTKLLRITPSADQRSEFSTDFCMLTTAVYNRVYESCVIPKSRNTMDRVTSEMLLEPKELSLSAKQALVALESPMGVIELSTKLNKSVPMVYNIIRTLLEQGLIVKFVHPKGVTRVNFALSKSGWKMIH